jgi:hypothetical protein
MKCSVCIRQAVFRSIYCQRCRPLVATKAESVKRQAALIEDYDESIDAFRCRWSGAVLDTVNRSAPFSLCFDHLIPRKSSVLDTSSMLFNSMKSDLGPDEFPRASRELVRHRNGSPFNRDIVRFRYWAERVLLLAPPLLGRRALRLEYTSVLHSGCDICGKPSYPHSIYCPLCRRFVFWGGKDHIPRVKALKQAWRPELGGFVCYYTGVLLDTSDPRSPWYMTFEHRTPGKDDTQVMAASWVNAMKTSLTESEFWAVMMEYDRYLREGGEFNRNIVKFSYWNRAVKGRVVA